MISRALLMLALLPGCAYQSAMNRGGSAAADSQWTDAYGAYAYANGVKPTDEAAAGMNGAIDGLLDTASKKANDGKFQPAFDLIAVAHALDPEAARIAEVRSEAQSLLVAALADRTEGELIPSYAFAVKAKRMHPTSWEIEDSLDALRNQVLEDAKAKQAAREWQEARDAVGLLLEHEPEQTTKAGDLDDAIVADWVTELTDRATKAQSSKPGLAAVMYARAYEVGEDEEHLEKARSFYVKAGETAPRRVLVDSTGSGGRHKQITEKVREAVAELQGVHKGAGKADLQARITTNGVACKESQEKEKLKKDYVSGQKQVPNPKHAELVKANKEAQTEQAAADKKVTGLQTSRDRAEGPLETLVKEHADAEKKHSAAKSVLDVTQKQSDTSKEARDKAKKKVDEYKASGDSLLEAAEKELADAQNIYDEWKAKLDVDSASEAEAKKTMDAVNAKLEPKQEAFDELETKLEAAEKELTEADKALAKVSGELDKTPETLAEDIPATHEYDKVTWTMTCKGTEAVKFFPKWKSELDAEETFEGEKSTTDTANKGHEKAEVKEDKKEYPDAKADMIAELDKQAVERATEAIDARLAEYFKTTADDALGEDEDIDSATDTLVRLCSGAIRRLDASARKGAVEYITTKNGLGDFALLDPLYGEAKKKAEEPKEEAKPEKEEAKAGGEESDKEEAKPEPKEEAKPEPKEEAKPEPKPAPKPEPKEEPPSPWG